MKYDITYSCGHDGTVDLWGKGSERERKINFFERCGLCPECYKAQMQKKALEDYLKSMEQYRIEKKKILELHDHE